MDQLLNQYTEQSVNRPLQARDGDVIFRLRRFIAEGGYLLIVAEN